MSVVLPINHIVLDQAQQGFYLQGEVSHPPPKNLPLEVWNTRQKIMFKQIWWAYKICGQISLQDTFNCHSSSKKGRDSMKGREGDLFPAPTPCDCLHSPLATLHTTTYTIKWKIPHRTLPSKIANMINYHQEYISVYALMGGGGGRSHGK